MVKEENLNSHKYDWFGLVWFYGISNIVGYLIQNTFLYITVLFQTIQFSINTVFVKHTVKYKNSSISSNSV